MTLLLDPRQRAMLAEMGVRTDFLPAAQQALSSPSAQPLASLAASAVSEMDWDALAQSVRECQACGL